MIFLCLCTIFIFCNLSLSLNLFQIKKFTLNSGWDPLSSASLRRNRKSHPGSINNLCKPSFWEVSVRRGLPYVYFWRTQTLNGQLTPGQAHRKLQTSRDIPSSRRLSIFPNHHQHWISSFLSLLAKQMAKNWKPVLNCIALFLIEAKDFRHWKLMTWILCVWITCLHPWSRLPLGCVFHWSESLLSVV